jgi:hypothetical protein
MPKTGINYALEQSDIGVLSLIGSGTTFTLFIDSRATD